MRFGILAAAVILVCAPAAAAARGVRIIHGNDDGWAELYARSLHDELLARGYDTVLSCPADNKSGTGSRDVDPSDRTSPCEYDSCPAHSGPFGSNATDPRLNWVNSFPVTAMRYGIDTFGPQLWDDAAPELAVSGPNVGSNVFLSVPFSGTVGAAVYAARTARIPAIAFSGASTGTLAWDTSPVPARSTVYAQLAARLVDAIVASGPPYLPDDVFLNVNFPKVQDHCTHPHRFHWVASRIYPGWKSPSDAETCGSRRLPTETDVVATEGCFISVSVGNAPNKRDTSAEKQAVVIEKLRDLLTCLP